MNFIANWQKQFPRLWSVRLSLLASLVGVGEVAHQTYVMGQPPIVVLSAALISLGAALARIVAQPSVTGNE